MDQWEKHVELGKKYRDNLTNFEGVAVGAVELLYGPRRIDLVGVGKDLTPEHVMFDEPTLTLSPNQLPFQIGQQAQATQQHTPDGTRLPEQQPGQQFQPGVQQGGITHEQIQSQPGQTQRA